MPKWLQTLVAITCVAMLGVAALATERQLPKLTADPPFVASVSSEDAPEPPSVHAMNATPEREKRGALGFCEYEPVDRRLPCWCAAGQINGVWISNCNDSEEYLTDVMIFGHPRNHAVVPFAE